MPNGADSNNAVADWLVRAEGIMLGVLSLATVGGEW
jgi:hypothetical protein